MCISILGESIHLVRPDKVVKPIVGKVWKQQTCRRKTVKEHCGHVAEICIQLINGEIKSLPKGTHAQVCMEHDISPWYVKTTGWRLDNGNYVWR
jgi:hypothetical protein